MMQPRRIEASHGASAHKDNVDWATDYVSLTADRGYKGAETQVEGGARQATITDVCGAQSRGRTVV